MIRYHKPRKERVATLALIHSCMGEGGWQQGDKGVYVNGTMIKNLKLDRLIQAVPSRRDGRGAKRWIVTEVGERVMNSRPLAVRAPARTVP